MYEYKVIKLQGDGAEYLEGLFNELGNDGWELVSAIKMGAGKENYFFKREKQE